MADRIADAAMFVIARDGHDALNARRVASEESVTGGTVQHHVPTKVELTVAALDRCIDRQGCRLVARSRSDSEVDKLIASLAALLSTDEDHRAEAVVWIAMSAAVSGQAAIEARHRTAIVAMRRWPRSSIEQAQNEGEVREPVDASEAGEMIEAGLDGMLPAGISPTFDSNRRARHRLGVLVQRLLLVA